MPDIPFKIGLSPHAQSSARFIEKIVTTENPATRKAIS